MFDTTEHLVEQVGHALVIKVHLYHLTQVRIHQLHHQVPAASKHITTYLQHPSITCSNPPCQTSAHTYTVSQHVTQDVLHSPSLFYTRQSTPNRETCQDDIRLQKASQEISKCWNGLHSKM